jgi:hypothetical protein
MLKITIHDSANELSLRLNGRLEGSWVRELDMCWQTALSTTAGRRTTVDLRSVDAVDAQGKELLGRMHACGVRFLAVSSAMRALIGKVTGGAEPAPTGQTHPNRRRRLSVSTACLFTLL